MRPRRPPLRQPPMGFHRNQPGNILGHRGQQAPRLPPPGGQHPRHRIRVAPRTRRRARPRLPRPLRRREGSRGRRKQRPHHHGGTVRSPHPPGPSCRRRLHRHDGLGPNYPPTRPTGPRTGMYPQHQNSTAGNLLAEELLRRTRQSHLGTRRRRRNRPLQSGQHPRRPLSVGGMLREWVGLQRRFLRDHQSDPGELPRRRRRRPEAEGGR
mmetsp:Transcript_10734/g.19305  ORF Transcript_10734/g.19305 Transcript_10734/m.19305 type:complete len:210 (+) Transcript_10734:1031-1660(+)